MCGVTDGSCQGVSADGRPAHRGHLLEADRQVRRAARGRTAPRSRSGSVATRSSVALRSGWIASSARAGTATPSRSSPAAARSAIGSRPGSSEPRKADVRCRASRSRSASSAVNSSVRLPSRVTASGVLAGHVDRDDVVAGPHVRDEGEGDPLGVTARHDEQRVLEDVQVGGGSPNRSGEPGGVPHRARLRRGDLGPRVAQLFEQLRAHPAEPAELERGTVGERHEHDERLRLGDRGDPAGRDAQRGAAGGLELKDPARHRHVAAARLKLGRRRRRAAGTGRSSRSASRGAALAAELRAVQRRCRNSRRTSSPPARRPADGRSPGRTCPRRSRARTTGTGRSPGRGS